MEIKLPNNKLIKVAEIKHGGLRVSDIPAATIGGITGVGLGKVIGRNQPKSVRNILSALLVAPGAFAGTVIGRKLTTKRKRRRK